MSAQPERSCAVCGCTELNACVDELRGPCHWVADRLCSHCAQPDGRRAIATIAAERLTDIAAELIRFSREGDQDTFEPLSLEPAENVAEALRSILQIQRASDRKRIVVDAEQENQLLGALDRFLEGWA